MVNTANARLYEHPEPFDSVRVDFARHVDFLTVVDALMVVAIIVAANRVVGPSVVTPKPANGGQGKTGQREEAGDSVVLPCRLLWRQVHFRTPTPRTAFEYMTMMEKTIEHGGNGSAISQ
jgi:hypothetical protein